MVLNRSRSWVFRLGCLVAVSILGGCKASIDLSPDKPQVQSQAQGNYIEKIEELETELSGIKDQNAARIKELEREVESLRKANPEQPATEDDLEVLKTFVTLGKLHDDESFRYISQTEDGKSLNALLEWQTDNDSEGMLVIDKQGIFLKATINEAKKPGGCDTLYEGQIDVYDSDVDGLKYKTFNHLCMSKNRYPLYLYHLEVTATDWGSGKFVLSEFIRFGNVDDDIVLDYFIQSNPDTKIIHPSY